MPPPKRPGRKQQVEELPLFETGAAGIAPVAKPWQAALFQSSVYAAQVDLLGRGAPKREHLEAVLGALVAHNGTILEAALARASGQPSFRLRQLRMSRMTRGANPAQTAAARNVLAEYKNLFLAKTQLMSHVLAAYERCRDSRQAPRENR